MLPSDMLITRTRKGKVHPVFAQLNKENMGIASDLTGVFKGSIGRKQGAIDADLEGIETIVGRVDYRLIRGLKTLLLRRCSFEVESAVSPVLARKKVFEEAAKAGAVTTDERRAKVLKSVARELEVTIGELEASLFADHDDQLILREFRDLSPEELLKSYNLSLAQTMLFKAMTMEISLGGNYQNVFRKIKWLGLMYLCEKRDGRFCVTIEGPLALFKMTEKYGTAMAKLLPDIVSSGDWEVKASIVLRGYDRAPRSLTFELDNRSTALLRTTTHPGSEVVYDSSVEEKFSRSFTVLDTGWTLTREPEPLIAGRFVFIPDFQFKKRGINFYMEVVGFWTEDYLKKKLYKLQHLKEENLLIAVDRKLACSEFKGLKGEVIYYDKEVPLKDVLKFLRRHEEKAHRRELAALSQKDIVLQGGVISVSELAEQYNVGKKTITEKVKNVEGYVLLGKEFVSQEKIEQLREKLEVLPSPTKYTTVEDMLKEEHITSINALLGHLGYEVKWQTMDPNNAEVIRKEKKK